jgi:hypothetical protein
VPQPPWIIVIFMNQNQERTALTTRHRPEATNGDTQVHASSVFADDQVVESAPSVIISPPAASEPERRQEATAVGRTTNGDDHRATAIGWLARRLEWERQLEHLRAANLARRQEGLP